MKLEELQEVFAGGWHGGEGTQCGAGSAGHYADDHLRRIREFLRERNIQSLADVGCGDCNWSRFLFSEVDDYHGYDLHEWESWEGLRSNHSAITLSDGFDIAKNIIAPAEGIIAVNVFIHLPNEMICAALERFKESEASWLFVWPHIEGVTEAENTARGEDANPQKKARPRYNLRLPPFNLLGGSGNVWPLRSVGDDYATKNPDRYSRKVKT
jgi:hypothetical protein